jgi:hypothetical protein
MPKMGVPQVYSDQFKIGAHNPKVVSSSLTPATVRPLGYSNQGSPTVFGSGNLTHQEGFR